jgi:hypothetical protein
MLSEKDKYEKVWEECARYGKDWTDRGLGRPYKRPFEERVPKGSTVIDFGCGNGSCIGRTELRSQRTLSNQTTVLSPSQIYGNRLCGPDLFSMGYALM